MYKGKGGKLMDKNIEDYLSKPTHRNTTVVDCNVAIISNYDRDVSKYCTSTIETKISWGTVIVTTHIEEHYDELV